MTTIFPSATTTSASRESSSDGVVTSSPPISKNPSLVQPTSENEGTSSPSSGLEASSSTEEKRSSIACDGSLRTLSIVVVIGTGVISVVVHLLVCWYCQRGYRGSHSSSNHYRTRQPTRRKRRKLRKKPAFMQIPLQSSSDCSI